MPYTKKQIKSKESYQNILDADKNELKKFFEDEDLKANISGSTPNAIRTLRNSEGMILSYEDPDNPGNTYPSKLQLTRIPMSYYDAIREEVNIKLKKERTFGDGFRPIPDNTVDVGDREAAILAREGALEEKEKQIIDKEQKINTLQTDLENAITNYAEKLAELQGD